MGENHALNGLKLDDDQVIDQQVGIKVADDLVFMPHLDGHFVLNFVTRLFQFAAQSLVVD